MPINALKYISQSHHSQIHSKTKQFSRLDSFYTSIRYKVVVQVKLYIVTENYHQKYENKSIFGVTF